MIRYTMLDPKVRRDLPYTEQFNLYGMDGITYPFQKSYLSFLCSALDHCHDQRERDFKVKNNKQYIAEGELPYTAWYLDANDELDVFFLRRLHNVAGDVAILKSKKSESHIILHGEAVKRNLNEGIADFVVQRQPIKEELQAIINAWEEYVSSSIPTPSEGQRFANRIFVESQLKQSDPAFLVTNYLYPIEHGEGNMWRNLEYYDHELRISGLPTYKKPDDKFPAEPKGSEPK